jgi:hypothetical protein
LKEAAGAGSALWSHKRDWETLTLRTEASGYEEKILTALVAVILFVRNLKIRAPAEAQNAQFRSMKTPQRARTKARDLAGRYAVAYELSIGLHRADNCRADRFGPMHIAPLQWGHRHAD